MKRFICLLGLVAPLISFAEFPIQSIECKDAKPSKKISVFFTTESDATDKYTPRPDAIAYEFGNLKDPAALSQSGQMMIKSMSADSIRMSDDWMGEDSITLNLERVSGRNKYSGKLTGSIGVDADWMDVKDHPLVCEIGWN